MEGVFLNNPTFAVSICSTLVIVAPGIWRLLFHTLLKISFAKLHQAFFLTPALPQPNIWYGYKNKNLITPTRWLLVLFCEQRMQFLVVNYFSP